MCSRSMAGSSRSSTATHRAMSSCSSASLGASFSATWFGFGLGFGSGFGPVLRVRVRISGQSQGQDELTLSPALASSSATSGQAGTTPRVKSKERRVRKPLNGWHVRAYASRMISLKLVAAPAALPPERRAGEWQVARRLLVCALAFPPVLPGLGQPSTQGGV